MEEKLELLRHGTDKAITAAVHRMVGKIGGSMNVPSRASDLSAKEEEVRCELTWQNFDEILWLAGCADQRELQKWVADAGNFMQDRADTWVVFSDQILLWVKIGLLKVLYAEFEIVNRKSKEKNQKTRKERLRKLRGSRGNHFQRLAPDQEEDPSDEEARGQKGKASEMEKGGRSQKRGAAASEDRCRITFEARQAVKGLFKNDPDQIKGVILPSE